MAKVNNKKINLESFLKDRVHDKIVEHLISLKEWDHNDWDETPEEHGPKHGDYRWFDGQGDAYWHDEFKAWMSEKDFNEAERQSELAEPALDLDSALSLELDSDKKINLEFLDKMIKESIKKHLKAK